MTKKEIVEVEKNREKLQKEKTQIIVIEKFGWTKKEIDTMIG